MPRPNLQSERTASPRPLARFAILLGAVLPGLTATAGSPETDKFSKMWVGKELWQFGGGKYQGDPNDWQSLAGSVLSLPYSGQGALPPPVEFVVHMDRQLPMGEYNVFVKNFYRGTMEITLGSSTQAATIKRYDWTPPVHFEISTPADRTDKIVLRYFPTMTANSGVKETQNYIVQGVFVTTDKYEMPFEGGRIIRLRPKAVAPSRPGNYLQDGSFESGFGHGWGKGLGTFLFLGPENLDATTAADGRYSLKIPLSTGRGRNVLALESRFYELNPDKKYSLSVWLKADRPAKVHVGLLSLPKDLSRGEGQGGLSKVLAVGTAWARHSVSGEINKDVPAYLYAVRFAASEETPCTMWIDAVQLEEGDPTPFKPRDEVDVGWLCPVPGHIYYSKEAAPVTLRFHNPGKSKTTGLHYAVEDHFGSVVATETRPIDLDGKTNVDVNFELYNGRLGIYRAAFRCDRGAESELVYSVLPPNPHLDRLYPEGTLGADTGAPVEELRILKRANFNWIMSKSLARWYVVEPERGRYQFDDNLVKDARAENLMVMLQFLNPDWGRQAWLKPLVKVHPRAIWGVEPKQEYLQAWSAFVSATVSHYKPWVRHFEIENEPNGPWLPEDYGQLLKVAHAAAKAASPEAVVVGFSGGGFQESFYDAVLATAGSSFDVASVHFYHNNADVHAAYAAFLKRVGRPGWNTETGPSCPSFYANLPTFESVTREDYRAATLISIRTITRHNVNNYLMSLSVGGMEKYMYYFCRFVNSSPTQPQLRQGSMKDCVEHDGALRANGVAMSVASHFIDASKYVGVWRGNGVEAHLFRRGAETVGFLWLRDGKRTLLEGAGLALYDIMGNPLAANSPSPEDGPVYFTSAVSPEAVKGLLPKLQVR